jgi:hypothetical protein
MFNTLTIRNTATKFDFCLFRVPGVFSQDWLDCADIVNIGERDR